MLAQTLTKRVVQTTCANFFWLWPSSSLVFCSPMLPIGGKCRIGVCVRVCAGACVCACVCLHVCVCGRLPLLACGWVMSHMCECFMSQTFLLLRGQNRIIMSRVWICHSHIWMCYVTRMNASCHTYECVMSHTWMSHAIPRNTSCHAFHRKMYTPCMTS